MQGRGEWGRGRGTSLGGDGAEVEGPHFGTLQEHVMNFYRNDIKRSKTSWGREGDNGLTVPHFGTIHEHVRNFYEK